MQEKNLSSNNAETRTSPAFWSHDGASKRWDAGMVICLERGADLHIQQRVVKTGVCV